MKLDLFPMDLLKRRVEYEIQRGSWPSVGRNFLENILPCEAREKQRRKQSLALCIGITLSRLFFTHSNSHFYLAEAFADRGGRYCS